MKMKELLLAMVYGWACAAGAETELHTAAEAGDAEMCRTLLAAGADANVRNEQGETALVTWLFVAENKSEVPEELIRATDVAAADNTGATALHYAAREDAPQVCSALIAAGAGVNARDAVGNTPLHGAAEAGEAEVCRVLLSAGADARAQNAEGRVPGELARAAGHEALYGLLPVPEGAETPLPGMKNERLHALTSAFFALFPEGEGNPRFSEAPVGRFARELWLHSEMCSQGAEAAADFPYLLYVCVICHHMQCELPADLLESFVAAGAEVDAADEAGATAFHWAVATAQADLCARLFAMGAQVEEWPPLHLAAILGDAEKCRELVAAGAEAHALSAAGWTPLMYAARMGREEVCRVLLAAGADVNARLQDGLTPLLMATEQGHVGVCRLLLAAGADVNALYEDDLTALFVAIGRGNAEMCRLLLSAGAAVNSPRKGNEHESPLAWAVSLKDEEICRLLLAAGADPNAADSEGNTPLHRAALVDHEPIYRLLIAAGADAERKNLYGMRADELL